MSGIYIIGATGNIGSRVYNRLVKEGVDIVPLVRKKSGLKNEIVCEFSSTALQNALRDARIVINTAGSVRTYDKNELEEANVELVKKIVGAVPKKSKDNPRLFYFCLWKKSFAKTSRGNNSDKP